MVWAQHADTRGAVFPPARAGGVELVGIVLDADASLVDCHSEKQQAAPTYKGGYGFHPFMIFCDNTGEFLAGQLRPGNAGAVRHEVARVKWMHRLEVRLMSTV